MNDFISTLESCVDNKGARIGRSKLTTLQVNMGNLCNQQCRHCHIDASPAGEKIMSRKVVDDIIKFIKKNQGLILDITGGAPELNPRFEYLITSTREFADEIIVRSNLTALLEPRKEHLPEFFKKNRVHLISSLPCYTQENVDSQRGNDVFNRSLQALRLLNNLGFAKTEDLKLDLVYNPGGAKLPPKQDDLEKDYKRMLGSDHNVEFNRLITITNVPIKRFKDYLESRGEYDGYLDLLKNNFNPGVLDNLMCRTFLSVGYDGRVYDCDFNQALDLGIEDGDGNPVTIDELNADGLSGGDVILGDHCLACTAGYGSSCQGVLTDKEDSDINCCDGEGKTDPEAVTDNVKEYYGKVLSDSKDLKTNACCPVDSVSVDERSAVKLIAPEVLNRFYGCGSPIPPLLEGVRLLDLGSGTGKDVYIASYLAGPSGHIIGVDMTDEQLEVANKYVDYHTDKFGYDQPNVEFKKGYIEDLGALGIVDDSIDIVISNCVINLSPDKEKVFKEIFRILKPGGELYFSDVFTGSRMPDDLKDDPVLYGECLGGALYVEDFRRVIRAAGFADYRVISSRKIDIQNPDIEKKVGTIKFYSMTIRAFKLDDIEDICEDYGQVATYLGTIPNHQHKFALDDHHTFITNKPMLVSGNTASMLSKTRYTKHFKVEGDRDTHYGPFECGPAYKKEEDENASTGGACC
ncbi:arsenosugar biosynthesis radical SAM (seleno)protein ArsS [Candidatus Omnitrophota bacterium]